MAKNRKQVVVEHPFVGWATEDERANTQQSDCQPDQDFQLDEEPEFAQAQLSPGEQGRNQEQVHDRRIHIWRGRLEGVRQNRQNRGRLPQLLEAVHPAEDSPPYQDANTPAPTDRCDGAGCHSNGQENRSQDDIDHVAAEHRQSCICRVHAVQNCNLSERAITPTTEEGVVRILVVSRATLT